MTTARENAIGLYMRGIRDGCPEEAMAAFTGTRYRQHSTGVADGRAGFIGFFKSFIERNPQREIKIIRSLQDGDKVFIQAAQSLNDGAAHWVTGDFFDSDGAGLIIEHWDVICPLAGPNPSGRTMIDGPTEVTDRAATDANRALVRAFVETCLIDRALDRAADYIDAEDFAQHSVGLADGLDAFLADFGAASCALSYQECFLLLAEGNFVATLNRARLDGQDICRVDLYRCRDGKIVEHWDLSEPCPDPDTLVNSGKF